MAMVLTGAVAAGAMTSASTVPAAIAPGATGGHAASSSGATTNPSSTSSVVPAGSQIGPDGTPNMTTARGSPPSRAGRRAIQEPGQANVAGSATGTRPRPRSASQARRSASASGTSEAAAETTCATQAANVERSVWRPDAM